MKVTDKIYRYTAHTIDGQSIVMEFRYKIFMGQYTRADWLCDTRGVQVSAEKLIALIPIGENGMAVKPEIETSERNAEKKFVALIDGDGDRWIPASSSNLWVLEDEQKSGNPVARTLESINEDFGIKRKVWE